VPGRSNTPGRPLHRRRNSKGALPAACAWPLPLDQLFARHPDLHIEIVSGVQTLNLHRRDADLAVRMHKPEAGKLTIKHLGTLGFGLYGARSYVHACRTGRDAAVLGDDAFIGREASYSHLPAAKRMARTLRGRACAMQTNTLSAQLAAAASGLGLAVLPHIGAGPAIWLMMHSDLAHSGRVRAVAAHLIALFKHK